MCGKTWIQLCPRLLEDGLGVEHDGIDPGKLLQEHQRQGSPAINVIKPFLFSSLTNRPK